MGVWVRHLLIKNRCEEIKKQCFHESLKEALFLSKTVCGMNMVRNLFELLCEEK